MVLLTDEDQLCGDKALRINPEIKNGEAGLQYPFFMAVQT